MAPLVVWWLVIEGLGLVALPLTFRLLSARAQHGYIFGKIASLLLITYVSWLLSLAGVPMPWSLPAAVAVFALVNLWLGWAQRAALGEWLRGAGWRALLIQDAFWTAAFLFFAWERSIAPEIFGAEKYMDFAFFNTLTRTTVMPPQDMWMAGKAFNYYYFGYLMWANVARLSGVANSIAYNLSLATVGGLAFGELALIGWTLTRWLPLGFLTGAVAMFIGNLDGFLQLWEKGGFTSFDYWRSTRVVGNGDTINEFPFFTTIHGDLHPHFTVLPVTILLLALLLDPGARRREAAPGALRTFRDLWPYVPLTFVLASMVVISPWELPVGAMVTFLLLGRALPLRPLVSWERLRLGLQVLAMLVAAYVLYAPFYLHFAAPPGGVGIKFAQTSLVQFLIVFGGLLAAPVVFLAFDAGATLALGAEQRQLLVAAGVLVTVIAYLAGNAVFVVLIAFGGLALACAYGTTDGERRALLLLLLAASVALLACELVYIKDPYGAKLYRMNTVFKLYFESWILLSIAAPWCVAQLLDRRWLPQRSRGAVLGAIGALWLASCAYPVGVTATRLHNRVVPRTLDGTEYLSREHPDDFAAIEWLRHNVIDLPVILEASGDPYSYYARFSANTGLPTVMGWANHEGLWRSNDPEIAQRRAAVARIYSAPTLDEVTPLLDQYRIKYVIVGDLERQDYPTAGLQKFAQLRAVFSRGGTTIYER